VMNDASGIDSPSILRSRQTQQAARYTARRRARGLFRMLIPAA
jgi:hypothetical protein